MSSPILSGLERRVTTVQSETPRCVFPALTWSREEVVMKGFVQDIEALAVKNDAFRRVLYTA